MIYSVEGRADKNPFIHSINLYYTYNILGTDDTAINKINQVPSPKEFIFLEQHDDESKMHLVNIYCVPDTVLILQMTIKKTKI